MVRHIAHDSQRLCLALLLALVVAPMSPVAAQAGVFEKRNVMIEMRDGVKLNTDIYLPRNQDGPLPIILARTPYDISRAERRSLAGSYGELVKEGYIFVFQDIRGKYGSDGTFMMIRPPRDSTRGEVVDETTDTNDTIDWLLANVANHNGRVGMLGISYGGWLTMMALVDPHPALKAASPQASPDDMFLGDDFHHNGAFRLSYGFEYVASLEAGRVSQPFAFDKTDTYEWFLELGGLANVDAKYFHGARPSWNDFADHPNFDEFWQRRKVSPYFVGKPVTVPTLTVGGWWDQEDFYGPLTLYAAMEKNDTEGLNYLVMGPWNHGGWSRGEGKSLGPIQFMESTALWYRREVEARWFAYWLKDKGSLDLPEALTFRPGSNAWQRHDAWPPKRGVETRNLFFGAEGGLGWESPTGPTTRAWDSYTSDPNRPVPYRARPIFPMSAAESTWPIWLVDDQRSAHLRPDVLSYQTETLADDVTIAGNIVAKLFASTSGSDSDWIVKLIDVYPGIYEPDPKMGGYQLMVANEVFRARFRNGFERPTAVVPNRVVEYAIDLHAADYTFKRGHRIMVQVQSTWFPLIDRNPQRFVPNIFEAKESDYRTATQRVFRSGRYPSHIELSVVTR